MDRCTQPLVDGIRKLVREVECKVPGTICVGFGMHSSCAHLVAGSGILKLDHYRIGRLAVGVHQEDAHRGSIFAEVGRGHTVGDVDEAGHGDSLRHPVHATSEIEDWVEHEHNGNDDAAHDEFTFVHR